MAGRDAALSDALRIKRNHLVEVTVALDFLLILRVGPGEQFKEHPFALPFANRDGWVPTSQGCKFDQRIESAQLPVDRIKRKRLVWAVMDSGLRVWVVWCPPNYCGYQSGQFIEGAQATEFPYGVQAPPGRAVI
jgi:hypothetical protein